MGISIHTPVKGVTARDRAFFAVLYISIHTPVKGVTLCRIIIEICYH